MKTNILRFGVFKLMIVLLMYFAIAQATPINPYGYANVMAEIPAYYTSENSLQLLGKTNFIYRNYLLRIIANATSSITNDFFADAIFLSGTNGIVTGNNNGATSETGEPGHHMFGHGPYHSVWWKWTALKNGTLRIDLSGTDFNKSLAIYTGSSVSSLTQVGVTYYNNNVLPVNVNAGVTYYIAVDSGYPGTEMGNIQLSWSFTSPFPPTNVQASDGTYTDRVRILWNNVAEATKYQVFRSPSGGGTFTSISSEISTNVFDDITVVQGDIYSYVIKAGNNNGWSSFSDSNDGYSSPSGIPGAKSPFVDITNQEITVIYDVSEYTIGGTNNANVVGDMIWSNQLTGITGSFTATANWVAHNIALKVGENAISIYGTNLYGVVSTDSVTITRGIPGTGEPNVDIVNADITVTFDVSEYTVRGINNTNVVGGMSWSNMFTGMTGTLPASSIWSIEGIALNVGANEIIVIGTNMYGVTSSDSLIITRGIPGTGVPVVDITTQNSFVTYDVTKCTIEGQNNTNVVGGLNWSNQLIGVVGTLLATPNWSISNITLSVGDNIIVVVGTNIYGDVSSDSINITRGVPGTGIPFLDITNENATVDFDVYQFTIGVTNNVNVVGTLGWINNIHATTTNFVELGTNIIINNLEHGDNIISVFGTNIYGFATNDIIEIHRETWEEVHPFIDITNIPSIVPYIQTETDISGTNLNIAGQLAWVNNRKQDMTNLFSLGFSTSIDSLAEGNNLIEVFGTNIYGHFTNDFVNIHRETWEEVHPFIEITNTLTTLLYFQTTAEISGTNLNINGQLTWINNMHSNIATFFTPGFKTTVDNLVEGNNLINVFGKNKYGYLTNDTILICRQSSDEAAPVNILASDGAYSDRIQINWNASPGANKYRVYRNKSTLTDGFTLISIELSETNFNDTTITPGEIYYYRVKAGKDNIWSSFSKCDSGYALFTAKPKIAWKYKNGKKFDILKGKDITPMLATNLLAGWSIGIATISANGTLTNFSGPFSLENKKNKNKLWFLKKKKEVIIKYKYNEKKMKDSLLYKLWDQMPNSKVLYLIPTNLETNQSVSDIFENKQFLGIELNEAKPEKMKKWKELIPVIIHEDYK